jgi:DNA-binding PadR family transcriptional regulator
MNSTNRTKSRLPPRSERALTDLEACVLGVVWRDGPCTAYAVRRELAASSTPRWSDSAGSIYPVLERLQALGLVAATARRWGERGKKELSATAAGASRLRAWVPQVTAADVCGPTYDPIRTRFCFLAALAPAGRRRFLDDAARSTQQALDRLRGNARTRIRPDDFEALSIHASICELEGRLRWLGRMKRLLTARRS